MLTALGHAIEGIHGAWCTDLGGDRPSSPGTPDPVARICSNRLFACWRSKKKVGYG